jgi:hypothetical protein
MFLLLILKFICADSELSNLTSSPEGKANFTSEFRTAVEKDNVISLCLELSDRQVAVFLYFAT